MRRKKVRKKAPAKPSKDPTRARWPKVDRLREIRQRFLENRWIPGHSNEEAAQEMGVSVRHINADAAEVHRRLLETTEEEETIRIEALGGLRRLQQSNIELRELALSRGQVRAAIEANRVFLDGLKLFIAANGIEPPKKLEVATNLGDLIGLALRAEQDEGKPED